MGNFFQQLGLQAGYNLIQGQNLELKQEDIQLKQQQIDRNKLDMMQQGQIMQARKEIAQTAAASMKADNAFITDPQKQITQQESNALKLEAAGDFNGARAAREQAKTLRQDLKENILETAVKVKDAKEGAAQAAFDYTENPSAETAAAFEKSYIKSGGNPSLLPKPGSEEYFGFVKQQRRVAMTAQQKVEDDQKELTRKEKAEEMSKRQAETDAIKLEQMRERREAQANNFALRKEMLDFQKQSLEERLASTRNASAAKASGGVYDRAAVARLNTASKEAAQSIQNLALLSQNGTKPLTAGVWDHFEGTGMLSAPLKSGTNEVNDPVKAMYTSTMLPLMRTAATVQGSGYYKLSDSQIRQEARALINDAGQSHITLLEKLAELKQTVVLGQEGALDSSVPNEMQRKTIQEAHDSIEKSIPWEVADVIKFQQTGKPVKEFGAWLAKNGGTKRYDKRDSSDGGSKPAGKILNASDFQQFWDNKQ